MADKIDPYDILTKLVLGTLFLCIIPIAFPAILLAGSPKYPSAFTTVVLVAAALFTGEVIQALASILQKVLFWSFRGNVSDTALSTGIKGYLTETTARRISKKLQVKILAKATDQELFQYASHMVGSVGRVPRFNAQYGYHRGMFFMAMLTMLIYLCSMRWGAAATTHSKTQIILSLIGLGLISLLWYRAKQWSCYFVKEVLLTAEQILDKNMMPMSEDKDVETKEETEEEPEVEESKDLHEEANKAQLQDENKMTLTEEIDVQANE